NKIGASSLTLSGSNSYSGGTNLTEGAIYLNNSFGLGSGTLTMTNATTLSIANGVTANNSIVINGANIFNVPLGSATLIGVISGAGDLNFNGPGSMTLLAANTYLGDTTVNNGTLAIANAGQLPTTTSVTLNS